MVVRIKKIIAALLAIILLSSIFTRISAIHDDTHVGDAEGEAIARMTRGFENFEQSIDLSGLNIPISSLTTLFAHATKNLPYLFYVDKTLVYTYKNDIAIHVRPKYNMTRVEADEAVGFCRGEIAKMADIVRAGECELERVILAHDLICFRYKYDLSLESNNIYTFIKEGKGTCQGYTWTYMALLREIGIECEYVASDSINHIWLRVKIDGEWYNSDPTWDDPVGNEGGNVSISRRHILFSDIKADADGYVDRYSASQNQCVSKKYDGADLSRVVDPAHEFGDVNHDGEVGLMDLVNVAQGRGVCPICFDVDGDLLHTENDIDSLRELILTKWRE